MSAPYLEGVWHRPRGEADLRSGSRLTFLSPSLATCRLRKESLMPAGRNLPPAPCAYPEWLLTAAQSASEVLRRSWGVGVCCRVSYRQSRHYFGPPRGPFESG